MAKKKESTEIKSDPSCNQYVHNHCMNTISPYGTRVVQVCDVKKEYCDRKQREKGKVKNG